MSRLRPNITYGMVPQTLRGCFGYAAAGVVVEEWVFRDGGMPDIDGRVPGGGGDGHEEERTEPGERE